MSQFNSNFWEIPVPPETLDIYSNEEGLWYEPPSPREYQYAQCTQKRKALTHVREIIERDLTPIQQRCIRLYFYEEKTQQEIAEILGISRRVVSQHLFGIRRAGKQIGGAINKIRKICGKRGILL